MHLSFIKKGLVSEYYYPEKLYKYQKYISMIKSHYFKLKMKG